MNGKSRGNILITILIFITVLFSACTSTKKDNAIKRLEPINFKETPAPNEDFLEELDQLRLSFGSAPAPKILTHNGITYYGFTKPQMVQMIKKNQAFRMLEEIAKTQHEKAKIYVMDINKLKKLAESEREQSRLYQDMYIATRDEAARLRLESYGYKLITIGSLVAIVAFAL